MSIRFALWVSLLSAMGCNGPFFLMPGGALDGEERPAPEDWSFVGDSTTIQIETHPEEPYSVNVVGTVVDGRLYVNAGDTQTRWVRHIAANPLVRVRIDGKLYDLRAERVTDEAEIDAFGAAWAAQSIFRRDPRELERVWIYRLEKRHA